MIDETEEQYAMSKNEKTKQAIKSIYMNFTQLEILSGKASRLE